MSNAIAYDPILVRHLADELDGRLRGRACGAALVFPGQRTAVLPLDGDEALSLELHPGRGWVRLVPWPASDELDARCVGVSAPIDERRLVVALQVTDRFDPGPREVQVELQGNQWNALLVDASRRILSLTWTRRAGERELRTGATYVPPAAPHRFGAAPVTRAQAWSHWMQQLGPLAREERTRALLGAFAHTGTLNARWIIEADSGPVGLEQAFERWWWLASGPEVRPVVLRLSDRPLPYPFPLGGAPAESVGSLVEGMERIAASPAPAGAPAGPRDEEVAGAARRLDVAKRRARRLEAALERGAGADEIRAKGDLLLARLQQVTRGAERVALEGWAGETVEIELDPTRSPAENAAAIYESARRRGRAEARLPAMIEEAEADVRRWEEALRAAEAGAPLPGWAIRALESDTMPGPGQPAEAAHPYRVYRTSGGLEVRVGRSAKDNDRLTFRSSSPDDVWLHARSVPGSHVILRWPQPDGAPPARDLEEAAGLAALFSRARSSALVPVDWTRRKHVRKPRGAPPGAVIPQRVKTLFVEPDPALAERLRRD